MPIWAQAIIMRVMRMYTDYGLMTTQPDICEDVHRMFQELTGNGQNGPN